MSVYQIDVQAADGYRKFAQAFGDLDTINYIAKKAVKEIEGLAGNLVLNLVEVDAIGGQPVREVVALVANAKVVATVLKGELTSERKAARTFTASNGSTVEVGDRREDESTDEDDEIDQPVSDDETARGY